MPSGQVEQTKEHAVSKERAAQNKILDLETQLSRTKTELSQLRRSRDDVSRAGGRGPERREWIEILASWGLRGKVFHGGF